MSAAHPEGPPAPDRVVRLLDLATRLLAARDRLAVARDALAAGPTRAPVLTALHDVLDAEVDGLDDILAGVYRLVELAEDSWDDLDGPDPVPAERAAESDRRLRRAVDNAVSDLGRLAGVHPAPQPVDTRAVVSAWQSASPEQVYQSVAGLPVAARRVLALAEPDTVGQTYGLPWRLRAMANAVRIRRRVHRAQLAGTAWNPRDWRLEEMLRRVDDPVADGPGPARRRRAYVAFSPERTGRMVELVGEVTGHTEAVGVYVPGTGTNLDMSHVNTEVAQDLVAAGGGRLAVLVFLDGEFPQDIMGEATEARFAERLAPTLVRFVHEVARVVDLECPGATVTVIGHSYGARVVGTAERLGMRADRVVYVEAPDLGTGVDGPADLRNPAPVRRFTLTAPADPVELLQIRAGLRRRWSVSDLADVGVRLDTGLHPDGTPVFGTHGHGAVFERGCGAFEAMLTVMLGGRVTLWRDREIRARHVRVRRGTDGRLLPALWRVVVGLGLRRGDDPYGQPRVIWQAPPRTMEVAGSTRTVDPTER